MARVSLAIDWSRAGLADLDRSARFLHQRQPELAATVAYEILAKGQIIADQPQGRQIEAGRPYRQVVIKVLKASYVLQYHVDGERLVVLRVFHGREARD